MTEAFERPHHSGWLLDEAKIELRRQVPTERSEVWAAYVEGTMAGAMSLWFPLLDNLSKCWGAVGVDPEHRRRGVGSALLQTLAAEVAPHHTDYRIASFADSLPDDLVASYCALSNQLGVDAPTGDVDFEAESMTPDLWLEHAAREKEMGRTRLSALAIDGTGTVVAYTDLILPPEPNVDVWQWGTLVHREHRGHRLGTAVKVRNLQQLAAAGSGRVRVLTCNAETNHHMVDINVRLGFEAIEVAPMFELRIDTAVGERGERVAQVSASTT